jgi:hypothetical protein
MRPLGWALAIAAIAGVGAGAFWWFELCSRDCLAMEAQANESFERGEPLAALRLIDDVDAWHHCSRFTSGDEPPEYALARVSIERLRAEGRAAEVEALFAHARGPILQELAAAFRGAQK